MKAKVGSILKGFSVHRKDGTVERYDTPLHNLMAQDLLDSNGLLGLHVSGTTYRCNSTCAFRAWSIPRSRIPLTGVYTQTGSVITRVSGDSLLGQGVLVWESGEWTNVLAQATTDTWTTSKSYTISGQNAIQYNTEKGGNNDLINTFVYSSSPRSAVYSNGVITVTNDELYFMKATAASTVASIGFYGPNGTHWYVFDLPAPLNMEIGDIMTVSPGDFVFTLTFDEYAPRALPVCPLTGLTTSCVVHRLLPVLTVSDTTNAENQAATRIYLINNGSSYMIPSDLLNNATVSPASLTTVEVISAGATITNPTENNNHLRGNQAVGTVVTGGATIKQIAWGSLTQIFGIIEFDTPQNISPGQVITIGSRLQVIPEYSYA